jgi:hypothetical protein
LIHKETSTATATAGHNIESIYSVAFKTYISVRFSVSRLTDQYTKAAACW